MKLSPALRQRIVQHQMQSMAIIDKNFPSIEEKLALVDRIQAHLAGKNKQSPENVAGYLKYLMCLLYEEILEADALTDG